MKLTSTLLPLMGALTLAIASQAYAQEQTVVIGMTGPLSGSNAFAGKDNENGVRLAGEGDVVVVPALAPQEPHVLEAPDPLPYPELPHQCARIREVRWRSGA